MINMNTIELLLNYQDYARANTEIKVETQFEKIDCTKNKSCILDTM